jgi:predicted nucleic-acid-binding Zn-ribbon protein
MLLFGYSAKILTSLLFGDASTMNVNTSVSTPIIIINDISENKEYGTRDPYGSVIPDKFHEKIVSLIDEMESETGQNYYISLRVEGRNLTEIYPLDERNRTYKVTMSDEKLSALDGFYTSLKAIKEKITALDLEERSKTVHVEIIKGNHVWKCPRCNAYGCERKSVFNGKVTVSSQINRLPYDNYCIEQCYNCKYDPKFKHSAWLSLTLYPQSGTIGTSSAGSLSIVHNLGTLKVIRPT